jgi:ABC-type phosphate transport system substrate-binding protein
MDLVQQGQGAWKKSGVGTIARPMLLWAMLMSIGLAVAFLAGTVFAGAGARPTEAAAVTGDPLTQPAAIEFRRSEHEATGSSAFDPLTQPASIEFRRSEHEASGAARSLVDPLTQPAAIVFRRSEHAEDSR